VGELIGFVSAPRPVEPVRPAGAFFSAVVEARVSSNTWKIRLDGHSLVVTTTLALIPGQTLRLKLVSQEDGRWIFQTASRPQEKASVSPSSEPALMAAFISRGLPIAVEKMASWAKWLGRISGPVDKEGWAASLETRGQGPESQMALDLQPWLAWQESLESGRKQPPPEDLSYWDLWNTRKTAPGDPWLVAAIRWTHEDEEDAGLLQAHWSPQAQAIDRWNLTAAPAEVPFRLEARTRPGHLDFVWHFFLAPHRKYWQARALPLANAASSPDLTVTMKVAGRPETPLFSGEGIYVEA